MSNYIELPKMAPNLYENLVLAEMQNGLKLTQEKDFSKKYFTEDGLFDLGKYDRHLAFAQNTQLRKLNWGQVGKALGLAAGAGLLGLAEASYGDDAVPYTSGLTNLFASTMEKREMGDQLALLLKERERLDQEIKKLQEGTGTTTTTTTATGTANAAGAATTTAATVAKNGAKLYYKKKRGTN